MNKSNTKVFSNIKIFVRYLINQMRFENPCNTLYVSDHSISFIKLFSEHKIYNYFKSDFDMTLTKLINKYITSTNDIYIYYCKENQIISFEPDFNSDKGLFQQQDEPYNMVHLGIDN